MSGPMLRLALRSLSHHKVRTVVLALCIALVGVLPTAVDGLLELYRTRLAARATSTPLVVGAPGSRSDLLIHALYFRGDVERMIPRRVAIEAGESGHGVPVPIHLKGSVNGNPLVGTTPDYETFRSIKMNRGHWPRKLAEAAFGSKVAKELGIDVGGSIATDVHKLHDLAGSYPLLLKVTGVLSRTGTPDDDAIFVSLQTSWVVSGEIHGHLRIDPEKDFNLVLENQSNHITANAAVVEAVEVTPENEDSFHPHGDPDALPVTAILIDANDDLYISDTRNHRVQKFTKDGALMAAWGGLGSGEGQLDSPWGIASDSEGYIYVSDHMNHRAQKFTPEGEFVASFGSEGTGRGELGRPSGVAVDPDGDVYVCDWSNNRVQVFGSDGRFITTLRGDAYELSHWAKMTVATNPDAVRRRREVPNPQVEWRFDMPSDLVFDTANQRLLVADTQRQRIQIYNKLKDYAIPSRTI